MSSLNIKDTETRKAIRTIEKKIDNITSIKQLPSDASLKDVIIAINKMSSNLKR